MEDKKKYTLRGPIMAFYQKMTEMAFKFERADLVIPKDAENNPVHKINRAISMDFFSLKKIHKK